MFGDAGFELGGVSGIRGEDNVAARDKSFDVAETEAGEEGFEFGHGEAAFAEIHAAQERDVAEGGHRLSVAVKPEMTMREPHSRRETHGQVGRS